jgi:hypothetical protein
MSDKIRFADFSGYEIPEDAFILQPPKIYYMAVCDWYIMKSDPDLDFKESFEPKVVEIRIGYLEKDLPEDECCFEDKDWINYYLEHDVAFMGTIEGRSRSTGKELWERIASEVFDTYITRWEPECDDDDDDDEY